jgi:hypothetical protein
LQVVAKNARATSFGKTKEMDDFTASLDPTYKICDPATVNRIAQALEHVLLEKLIAKHAELREQRGSPFTVRVLFSLFSCDRVYALPGCSCAVVDEGGLSRSISEFEKQSQSGVRSIFCGVCHDHDITPPLPRDECIRSHIDFGTDARVRPA